ncbi:MAG: molecular chaperone [Cryobacterium sp.]|nr:molecular chaperone [Cryobacterium sp.]
MPESPAAATPYEVLGVSASASEHELRRAYRRLLRQTHPDIGGSATRFHAVQHAWELVGTPANRAAYDRARFADAEPAGARPAGPGYGAAGGGGAGRAGSPGASGPGHSGPRARTYGHPGGHARQQYLALVREWAGRGTSLQDPYDPELVRAAPREIRRTLAKALAEEATAQLIAGLGIGFTAWHDVDPGRDARKLDHVVLGPAGLFAVLSEDWGGIVQLRRGELVGDVIDPGEEPMAALERSARSLARSVKVRFTALVITVPDGSAEQPFTVPGRGRRPTIITVPRSRLVGLLRDGLPGMERGSFEKVFELRSRLQNGVRFIAD